MGALGYTSFVLLALVATSMAMYIHRPNVIHKLIDEHHEVHDDSDYHHGFGNHYDGHYGGGYDDHYGGGHYGGGHYDSGYGQQSGGYGHQSSGYGYQPPQVIVIKKIIPLSTTAAPGK